MLDDTRLIIFDCDGTLVNTESLHTRLQRETIAALGVELTEQYVTEHMMGHRFTVSLEKLSQSHGLIYPSDTAKQYSALFRTELAKTDITIFGARETVVGLMNKYKVCVASNGNHDSTCHKLKRIGLIPPLLFTQVFSAMDVAYPKPAPDVFLHAMQVMGENDPEKITVVEDSFTGLRAGLAAGMKVVWINPVKNPVVPEEFSGNITIINNLNQLAG